MKIDKVFEALERLKTAPSFMGGTEKYMFAMNSGSMLLEDYELIKQALLELKAIKESNPSEALNDLESYSKMNMAYLKKIDSLDDWNKIDILYKRIKQSLLNKSKKEKAFEKIQAIMDTWYTSHTIDNESALKEINKIICEVLK